MYSALSFDRLHNNHGGFFSDHIWEIFKKLAEKLGKTTQEKIETKCVTNFLADFPVYLLLCL